MHARGVQLRHSMDKVMRRMGEVMPKMTSCCRSVYIRLSQQNRVKVVLMTPNQMQIAAWLRCRMQE